MIQTKSNWLVSPGKETVLILLPLFLPVLLVFVFQNYFDTHTEVTMLWWLVLILMVDVSHVYSTLFRFYWEPATFQKYKSLLILIPVCCFVVGVALHLISSFLFWRVLAYAALFHFVRQQYGFLRLYSRTENTSKIIRWIDGLAIYNATLYPVIYWHLHLTDSLSWFVPHDFISVQLPQADTLLFALYGLLFLIYLIKEIYLSVVSSAVNIPKNGIVIGTYVSWYAGIVFFHGDLAFTLMNVVSHGIPYMGLIWLYGEKKRSSHFYFGLKGVALFILILFFLSYFEESLWDVLVWKDHLALFPFFTFSNPLTNSWALSLVVPLLVLPQVTHYVLDGFIWRFSKDSTARLN